MSVSAMKARISSILSTVYKQGQEHGSRHATIYRMTELTGGFLCPYPVFSVPLDKMEHGTEMPPHSAMASN